MDKDHVAAAIERHAEKLRDDAKAHDTMANLMREQAAEWEQVRLRVVSGQEPERELRKIYQNITGVIVLGGTPSGP